jgi:hypothetical protein
VKATAALYDESIQAPGESVIKQGTPHHAFSICSIVRTLSALFTIAAAALAQTPSSTSLAVQSAGANVTNINAGSTITLTAQVSAGAKPVFPGQLNFCDATVPACTDIHLLHAAQVNANGVATFRFIPGPGVHSFRAKFLGTTGAAAGVSAVASLNVISPGAAATQTQTTITSAGQAGNYTLTATVTNTGTTFPTGYVSFLDATNSNYMLANAPLGVGANGLSFVDQSTLTTNQWPSSIVTADFNGDGIPDIATLDAVDLSSNTAPGSLSVFIGKGDGTFSSQYATNVETSPISLTTGDFNNDGIPDLLYTGTWTGDVVVLLGNGDGTFEAPIIIKSFGFAAAWGFAVGDFNHDGNQDIATVDGWNGVVSILLGNGDGTFTESPQHPQAGVNPVLAVTGDLNGDGNLDLVVANVFPSAGSQAPSYLTVLLGKGDGTFNAAPNANVGVGPESILLADFNGDGKLDLAVSNIGTGQGNGSTTNVMVLLGNGDGTFAPPASTNVILYATAIATGDFNGDGLPDLAVTLENNNVPNLYVLLGKGDGTFDTVEASEPGIATAPTVADFNGDGRPDVAVMDQVSTVHVMLSAWGGAAQATVTDLSPVGTGTHYVGATYAGDNIYSGSVSSNIPLTAEPVATTLTLAAPSSSTLGQNTILSTTLTPDTAQNHDATGTVSFSIGSTLLGKANLAFGQANLLTNELPAGHPCVTAVYSGDTNFATSMMQSCVQVTEPGGQPTITFSIPDHTFGDPPFAVAASSNSAGAITYSILGGPATVQGSIITLHGAGTVTVDASQAATSSYAAAQKQATFIVAQATQTINFPQPQSPVAPGTAVPLNATSSSGFPVSYTVVSGSGTLSGSTINPTAAGTIVVQASVPASANYLAGAPVSRSIVVTAPLVSITLTASPSPVFLLAPITLQAKVSTLGTLPQGTVTFTDGAHPLGSVPITNGAASLTLDNLALGAHSIQASFTSAATGAILSPIVPVQVEDFALILAHPQVTIAHGGTASFLVQVSPVGGQTLPSAIAMSLNGMPSQFVAKWSQSALQAGSTAMPLTITIKTPDYPIGNGLSQLQSHGCNTLALLVFTGTLLGIGRRRRLTSLLALLLLTAAISVTLSGCGSGWGTQTFNLSVSGTSGALTHSSAASIISQ